MTNEKAERETHAHDGHNLTETMKIEKNIPIPSLRQFVRNPKWDELKECIQKMEIADSILVPHELTHKGSFTMSTRLGKSHGMTLTQRKTPEGVRIWRIA